MKKKTRKQHSKSYMHIHYWLESSYGKASKCENKKCKQKPTKRYEWALKKGYKYEKNVINFMQLCVPCHKIYDDTPERRAKISKAHKGKPKLFLRKQYDCNIGYCKKTHRAKGFCSFHYLKLIWRPSHAF